MESDGIPNEVWKYEQEEVYERSGYGKYIAECGKEKDNQKNGMRGL